MERNLEEYLMPIEYGLTSEIYLHAYEKPKSGYKIANEIYNKYHHSIISKINELEKEGYFVPISIEGKKHPKWLSSVNPLILMIEFNKKQDNIKFSDFDRHVLTKLLDSEAFRKYVSNPLVFKNIRGDFNSVDFILQKLDYLAIEYLNSKAMCEIGTAIENKIKNKEQYDDFIRSSLKSSSRKNFDDVVSSLIEYRKSTVMKSVPDWCQNEQQLQTIFDIIEKMVYFFYVPKGLMEKIRGVSEFGQMESVFKAIFSESQEMDNFAKFLLLKEDDYKLH